MKYICPVCGYPELNKPPYGGSPDPSYEICNSCGFEFGYDDHSEGFTFQQWRQKWIEGGMVWWSTYRKPPENWNPAEQVSHVMHIEGGGLYGEYDVSGLRLPEAK